MKDLIIIGAGGLGREALATAMEIKQANKNTPWQIKGFITDIAGDFYEKNTHGYDIIGTIKNHEISDNNVYVFAIADIPFKKKTVNDFVSRGAEFINLISPFARVLDTAEIGTGNIIQYGVSICSNVKIGDFNLINSRSIIGHDAKIGNYNNICPGCAVTGYVTVGDGVFIGSNAVLCPHSKVGSYSRVGAGSVVLKKVKENTLVVGNPAKLADI